MSLFCSLSLSKQVRDSTNKPKNESRHESIQVKQVLNDKTREMPIAFNSYQFPSFLKQEENSSLIRGQDFLHFLL